jgi:hypothetical protein
MNGAADEKSPGTCTSSRCSVATGETAAVDRRPRLAQHALGVVAGRHRLLDDRHPVAGEEPGQEHARLHLGRCHRQAVGDGLDDARDAHAHRWAALGRLERDAHLLERRRDPAHRPAADALVAVEHELAGLAGQDAWQEPHEGAGVVHVDALGGRAQTAQADAADPQRVGCRLLDLDAERPHRLDGRHGVRRRAEALDRDLAVAQRRHHHRPVADRLVARHGQLAGDRAGRGVAILSAGAHGSTAAVATAP